MFSPRLSPPSNYLSARRYFGDHLDQVDQLENLIIFALLFSGSESL
jgi:hypothetical protein